MNSPSRDSSPSHDTPPPIRKIGPMDLAHVQDWDPLNLGHARVSKQTVSIVDLDAHVHGLQEIEDSDLPVAVVNWTFALQINDAIRVMGTGFRLGPGSSAFRILGHGFAHKALLMDTMAWGIIGECRRLDAEGGRRRTRDVLVVTLDHRNHGDRRRIKTKADFSTNPMRLINSASGIVGGKLDQQYIMDFLPSYLFPRGEKEVVEFMSAGFSMGGHVTWRLLREDPRIRIGVPICSAPSEALGKIFLSRSVSPPSLLPPPIREFFESRPPPSVYDGKKILSVHGRLDAVLPVDVAQPAIDALRAVQPGVAQWVQEDRGHVISPEMVVKVAEWFWYWGLTEER